MSALPASFAAFLASRGLPSGEADRARYGRFLDALLAANEVHNLTAVRDAEVAVSRHLEDALELVHELRACGARKVLDLGTGGGVPGIPLALALPDVRFTLVDAREKKVAIVDRIARDLGLANVRTLAGRAEELARRGSKERDAYDALVSRALAPMPVLVEWAAPFLRVGGVLLATKGERAEVELVEAAPALEALGLRFVGLRPTPTGRIVELRKERPTPVQFPRPNGEAKRRPLA